MVPLVLDVRMETDPVRPRRVLLQLPGSGDFVLGAHSQLRAVEHVRNRAEQAHLLEDPRINQRVLVGAVAINARARERGDGGLPLVFDSEIRRRDVEVVREVAVVVESPRTPTHKRARTGAAIRLVSGETPEEEDPGVDPPDGIVGLFSTLHEELQHFLDHDRRCLVEDSEEIGQVERTTRIASEDVVEVGDKRPFDENPTTAEVDDMTELTLGNTVLIIHFASRLRYPRRVAGLGHQLVLGSA